MLVLKRRLGEWITIGDDIRIRVITVGLAGVSLGIEAPPDVVIARQAAAGDCRLDEGKRRGSEKVKG